MAQWGFRASAASGEAGLLFGYQQEFPQSGPQFGRDWQGAVGGLRHGRRPKTTGQRQQGRGYCEPQKAVAVQVDKQMWCFPTREAAAPSCEDEGKGGDCRSGFARRDTSAAVAAGGGRARRSQWCQAGEWVARAGSLSCVSPYQWRCCSFESLSSTPTRALVAVDWMGC